MKRQWPDFGLEQEIVKRQRRRRSWLLRLGDHAPDPTALALALTAAVLVLHYFGFYE